MEKDVLKKFLYADSARYGFKKPRWKDYILNNEVWFIYHYIRHLRYIEYYQNKRGIKRLLFFYHFLLYKRYGFKLHFTIYPDTIGPGFRIYHVGGFTHVGKNVRIGKNCTMLPGVVFGNKTEADDDRPVVVGDNCYLGLNAKILGPVTIGDNVTVGANAVVTKDIPDNAIVGGTPAKVIKFKKDDK